MFNNMNLRLMKLPIIPGNKVSTGTRVVALGFKNASSIFLLQELNSSAAVTGSKQIFIINLFIFLKFYRLEGSPDSKVYC